MITPSPRHRLAGDEDLIIFVLILVDDLLDVLEKFAVVDRRVVERSGHHRALEIGADQLPQRILMRHHVCF